ncbi:MAG: DUF6624 domain-containing protein [Pseudomonadota bacterium]
MDPVSSGTAAFHPLPPYETSALRLESQCPFSVPELTAKIDPLQTFLLQVNFLRCPEGAMSEDLRKNLIALAEKDRLTRKRLIAEGALFEGYHPEMQALHESNADRLAEIIPTYGWPTSEIVGPDGAEAAWLIVQHAISRPAFQKACLTHLQEAADAGSAPPWQPAMLLDRIRMFEGLPQIYGTQFDWDDAGEMSPVPIQDPVSVDDRRAKIGLPSLKESLTKYRARLRPENRPTDLARHAAERQEWLVKAGWRSSPSDR